jgi:AraC-like DNA-binding protein
MVGGDRAKGPNDLAGEPIEGWMGEGRPRSALPADLVRALDWLRGHLAEPVDLERLALIAGVRPRTLETHFRVFLDTTPLGWVRRMRLWRARRELQRSRADASVTEVALASGFTQLGRFSAQYYALFGELPSSTLGRSRRGADSAAMDDEALRLTLEALPSVFAIAPRECNDALKRLEHARRLAPSNELCVALAAWCWGQRAAHGFSATPQQDREQGLRLAADACSMGPGDALTLTLVSGALTLAHRVQEADELLERALAHDPWLPYAWVRRGWGSVYMGDPEAAFRELRTALHFAPFGPLRQIAFIGMGCAHFAVGRYDRAARWVQSGTKAFPGAFWADRIAVAAAVHTGAKAEARRIARRLMRKDPGLTTAKARRSWPFPPAFMERVGDGLAAAGVPQG